VHGPKPLFLVFGYILRLFWSCCRWSEGKEKVKEGKMKKKMPSVSLSGVFGVQRKQLSQSAAKRHKLKWPTLFCCICSHKQTNTHIPIYRYIYRYICIYNYTYKLAILLVSTLCSFAWQTNRRSGNKLSFFMMSHLLLPGVYVCVCGCYSNTQ